ncbi:ATP-dependent DNA helicase [Trichonephila clavata]|uniref:ATP-dependent DNA helicase n=1 Tax=Trichonephila clavata TaxID=2740835 RepID=A0A8X6IS85_TRICU|nr:ATP-dependent DNA helicase [Trichonephila clavata]
MPMRKRGSLGRKTVKSKAVEHTRTTEAPDEKRARLQADQISHSLARTSETPEQYQVRLQSQQVRQNASRAAETPEQRCLHEGQVRHRVSRAAETSIQHVARVLGLRKQRNVAITLKWKAQMHDGFMYNPRYDYESNNLFDIGRMSNVFLKRSALKWKGEIPVMCCSSGKVKLPPILKPPEPLCSLLKGETTQSKDFVKHIRLFNNMFAMTSFKSNVVLNNGWTPTFKVQGQVYHHAGPLHPANSEESKYLQIYFLGENEQVQTRLDLLYSPVDRNNVLKLQRMRHQHNSYVRSFKRAAEMMDDNTQVDYRIKISGKAPLKEHKGRFNAPSVSEVAIMIARELGDRRNIVLHSRSCSQMPLQRIQDTHRTYDRLQYPLLFVRGEDGYDFNTKGVNKATNNDYYAYHMMQRVMNSDLRGSSAIMGGATVVLAGDFRQTLPIVTRGTLEDQINACLKNSYPWHHVKKFSLTTNTRSHIQGDLFAGQFANKLLQIGDGKVPEDSSTGLIIMPCGQIVISPDELLSKMYHNIRQNFKDQDWLSHREILASRNDVVEKLNVTIQKQLPGKEYAYKSIDCILNDDEAIQYPIEFLNYT